MNMSRKGEIEGVLIILVMFAFLMLALSTPKKSQDNPTPEQQTRKEIMDRMHVLYNENEMLIKKLQKDLDKQKAEMDRLESLKEKP